MEIQIEGLTMGSFSVTNQKNDRELYLHNVWDVDIMNGAVTEIDLRDPSRTSDLDEIAEEVAYLYLRNLIEKVSAEKVSQPYQYLYDLIKSNLKASAVHYDVLQREIEEDSLQEVMSLRERSPLRTNLAMIKTLGEALPSIFGGKVNLLQQSSIDSALDRYFAENPVLGRMNKHVGRMVKQIAHRYPRMNVLEVGSEHGGLTKSILEGLGPAFSTYTFTAVDTKILERMQRELGDQDRKLSFKTLTVEEDVTSQGFSELSYDLIVCSSSIYASKSVEQSLQNIRRLTRPGGYLMLLEPTSDLVTFEFVLHEISNLWFRGDSTRSIRMTVSPVKWDRLLRDAGFAGIDSITHDSKDIAKHSMSLILSQAVDEQIQMLRRPLQSPAMKLSGHLLIIGGESLVTSRIISNLSSVLFHWTGKTTRVDSLENLDPSIVSSVTVALVLADLDEPVMKSMTPRKLKSIQQVFDRVRNVLWITQGSRADNPYHTATVGLGRCASTESASLRLQFLDLDVTDDVETKIAESLFRLVMADLPELTDNSRLWSTEHEIVLERGQILIPRVLPLAAPNDRLNSVRRVIRKDVTVSDNVIEIVASGTSRDRTYGARQGPPVHSLEIAPKESVTIRVRHCTLSAIHLGNNVFLYVFIGNAIETGEKVLGFTPSNASIVTIPTAWQLPSAIDPDSDEYFLEQVATYLVGRSVVESLPAGTSILHEPHDGLASIIAKMLSGSDKDALLFTTKSQPTSEKTPWITIHNHASKRMISSLIPPRTKSFVNLGVLNSDSVQRILECLPSKCDVQSQSTFVRAEPSVSSAISFDPLDLLTQATTMTLAADPLAILRQSSVPTVAVSSLVIEQQAQLAFAIVDWSSASTVTVLQEPVDPTTLFSPAKTYFLVGLTGDLGESLCRWMVLHGARYFVISSRYVISQLDWANPRARVQALN